MGKALKSVLGKGRPQSDLKSLPLAQGHTTNPDLIHKSITIFNSKWEPQEIDIQTTTAIIKYLGVEISMDGDDQLAFTWAEDRLRQALLALGLRKATHECKMQVVRFSILPKILYRASKASWPLSWYWKLDLILARGIKKIMGKWKGYSHELLFIPLEQGGIGCPRISDLSQEYKWSAIQRALTLGGQPAHAAKGLIERVAHKEDIQLTFPLWEASKTTFCQNDTDFRTK